MLFLVFMVTVMVQAYAQQQPILDTGDVTKCITTSAVRGDPATVTCYFPTDVRSVRPVAVTVERHREEEKEAVAVLECQLLEGADDANCAIHDDGYTLFGPVGEQLSLNITALSERHAGSYACKMMTPKFHVAVDQRCSLEILPGVVSLPSAAPGTVEGVTDENVDETDIGNSTLMEGSSQDVESNNTAEVVAIVVIVVAVIASVVIAVLLYRRRRKQKLIENGVEAGLSENTQCVTAVSSWTSRVCRCLPWLARNKEGLNDDQESGNTRNLGVGEAVVKMEEEEEGEGGACAPAASQDAEVELHPLLHAPKSDADAFNNGAEYHDQPRKPGLQTTEEDEAGTNDAFAGPKSDPESVAPDDPDSVALDDPNSVATDDPNSVATDDPNAVAPIDPDSVAQIDSNYVAPNDPNSVAPFIDPNYVAPIDPNSVAPFIDPNSVAPIDPNSVAQADPKSSSS